MTTTEHEAVPMHEHESLGGFTLASHLIHDHKRMPALVWGARERDRITMHDELHKPSVLCRIGSHRAAQRVERIVGGELDWHYTMADGGTFALIPGEHVHAVLAVKSVTRARPKGEVRRCISMMGGESDAD